MAGREKTGSGRSTRILNEKFRGSKAIGAGEC